jgi:predicted Zn-dependent protease
MTTPELTSSLAADPGNWELRLSLVQALVAEARHDAAIEVVNQGEAIPHEPGPWLAAARTYAAVGAVEQARGLVASALEIDPNYEPAKAYQAELRASIPAVVSLTAEDLDDEVTL